MSLFAGFGQLRFAQGEKPTRIQFSDMIRLVYFARW